MIEKANIATKILLAGSMLWVGTMVFRADQNLKQALTEIGEAKKQINEAKANIDSARQNIDLVKSELTKLSSAADRATTELNYLRVERERMKSSFDAMIKKSNEAITSSKSSYEDIKKSRLNLLKEIRAMNLDREPKNQ